MPNLPNLTEILHFAVEHWILVALLLAVVAAIIFVEINAQSGGKTVSPQQAISLINNEKAVVIDLRSQADFVEGHLVQGRLFDKDKWDSELNKLNKYKDKPIIVTDLRGQASRVVATKLLKAGFSKATVLRGGITAWTQAKLPLVKS